MGIEIVKKYNKYFHPIGGNGWPKEPPNYIAFRYGGKLQAIYHIGDYVVTKNLYNEVAEMLDVTEDGNFFVYKLGSAIVSLKEVKYGKIYLNGRVWPMLDTLITSDTISEARYIESEVSMNVEQLLNEFMELVAIGDVEVYNEFSLQHELGIFLRTKLTGYKVQFERNTKFFGISGTVKHEIDILVRNWMGCMPILGGMNRFMVR